MWKNTDDSFKCNRIPFLALVSPRRYYALRCARPSPPGSFLRVSFVVGSDNYGLWMCWSHSAPHTSKFHKPQTDYSSSFCVWFYPTCVNFALSCSAASASIEENKTLETLDVTFAIYQGSGAVNKIKPFKGEDKAVSRLIKMLACVSFCGNIILFLI